MAKNMDQELKRLSESLLAEEQKEQQEQNPFEEDFCFEGTDTTPAELNGPYRNFANGYRAQTNQPSDVDLENFSDQVYEAKAPSNKPLIILALTLAGCIILLLLWWAWRLGGFA